jgi:FAD/FMN-containing dehydrogenase
MSCVTADASASADALDTDTGPGPGSRIPISTSSVSPLITRPRGRQRHRAAVERLLESYQAIPPGSAVRLSKRTSNLFRPRAASDSPGLDVAGLDGVITVDETRRLAEVQGVCTYETLVGATLRYGLMPTVVPQLKTITLGGAVTGLGIESSSFRVGLPHESIVELDILTGAGEIVTATPTNEHAELFRAFPNSYGTLGYAVRLVVQLEPVKPVVSLRNLRFAHLDALQQTLAAVAESREYEGEAVDFLDGVVFSAEESYLVLGSFADDAPALSDYTGEEVYYLSLRNRGFDALTIHDYLWRWDTDWFWCSKAFGAQNRWVRRVWPAASRRSDVFHRLVGLEQRYGIAARIDRLRGLPARERVIQDVEVPVGSTADFLRWFLKHVPLAPVWLCPLRLRDAGGALGSVADDEQPWPLYPLRTGKTWVNIGFWGLVPIIPGRADGDVNRLIENQVAEFGGHKSLYSDAYYPEHEFWQRYGGEVYHPVKKRYDPAGRLLDLYAKTVGRR